MAGSRLVRASLVFGAALAAVMVVGAAGPRAADEPTCLDQQPTIVGTDENDVLNGTEGEDVIAGLGGDDLVRGLGGDDVICGGDGNDQLYGSNGGAFFDLVSGDAGDDVIDGGSAVGGIVVYVEASGPVTIDLAGQRASGWGNDRLVRIRGVLGSDFGDTINGSPASDVIAPFGGDDVVATGAGNDVVLADPGNDRLDGGASSGDTLEFQSGSRAVSVNLATGKASGLGADRVTGFENVDGTRYADVLTGNASANRLQGGAGNDRLFGGPGRDTLVGQQGRDFADGGGARDRCSAERKRRCP